MPVTSKTFTYEVEGLSYSVNVYEGDDGGFYADITVEEGAMDVNAVYFGDDDYSGDSEMLNGPLNMNGARGEDGDVQWDNAQMLSKPGLGRAGTDKETYVSEGDTLTIELDINSLDEIDVFGIRATSTTTPEGSIKGVSEEPEEEEEEDDLLLDKVAFGYTLNETGGVTDGLIVSADDLPDDVEPTFENYLTYFEEHPYGDVDRIESVIFYETNEDGYPEEIFRIDAPEGGFEDTDDILAAYDEAIEDGALDEVDDALSLMAALSLDESEDDLPEEPIDDEVEDDLLLI